jgi:hypothetical protein
VANCNLARASTTLFFQNAANLLASQLAPGVPRTVDAPSETAGEVERDVATPTDDRASTVSPQGHNRENE